jgi:hypothetical protein
VLIRRREVTVSARAALVLSVLYAALSLAADPPKPPSPEEIAAAVRQLGDARYAAREQATKRLWQAGPAAEAALREAANSPDAEVARRARALLDRFDWGIYADTPNEVVALIEKYRDGDPDARRQAVGGLVAAGRPGLVALARLGRRATAPEDRRLLAGAMTVAARDAVPRLIGARDFDAAGAVLEACLIGDSDAALSNYAAFVVLRGQLDAAIARWQGETPPRHAVLAVLLRARGDLPAARKHAAASGNTALLDEVLWEQGDWAELARRPAADRREAAANIAAAVLLHRLAGDAKAADADLDTLRRLAKADEKWAIAPAGDEAPVAWTAAKALLLTGRPAHALKLLDGAPEFRPALFDLLAAQLRYREALAVADRADAPADADRAGPVRLLFHFGDAAVKQARLLYLLGDADRAGQVFAKAAAGLKTADDLNAAVELAEAQVRLGLTDAAREQVARFLGELSRETANVYGPRQLLGAVFPKRGDQAFAWWAFFRQKFPQDDVGGTMKRVRGVLDPPAGAAPAGPGEWAEALVAAQPPGDADAAARAHEALAAAYESAGQLRAARAALTRAAETAQDATRWLRLGDFLAARREYAAAAAAYEESAKRDPTGALPVYLHGRALEQAGRAADGRDRIELAHWLPLGNVEARAELAAETAKRGHDDLARRERDLVLKLGWPRAWSDGNFLSALAREAVARRDYAAAADRYERLIALLLADGKDFAESSGLLGVPALVHVYRARAAVAADKFDDARAEADRCLTLTPGNLDLALLLVPELDRRGRRADADALYARVAGAYAGLCREFPRSPFAHNAAAWLSAGCRRDLDAALDHARTAVAQAPKNAGFLDTLAEVHFQRGEQAAALEAMRKCLVLDPKNAYLAQQLRRFEAGDRDAPVPPEDED